MRDSFDREIDYLRLSVTDLCNFRCVYCMAPEGVCKKKHGDICSLEELLEMTAAAVGCGIRKVRVTGGEPLVRRNIEWLCREIKGLDGVEELTLTTNGSLLSKKAETLKAAGVDRLNISIDSLDRKTFSKVARSDALDDVLDGINAAQRAGFENTKLNVVLLGQVNTAEAGNFIELTRNSDITVRFIELMPVGVSRNLPGEYFVSADTVIKAFPQLVPCGTDGVSRLYKMPGYRGHVGFISPLSCGFCGECSRIRITCDGRLKPCLHSSDEINLRGLHGRELEQAVRVGILSKPERHFLNETGLSGSTRNMNRIGG